MSQTSRNLDAARRRNRERADAASEPKPEPEPIEVRLRKVMILQLQHRLEETVEHLHELRETSVDYATLVSSRVAHRMALDILQDVELTDLGAMGALLATVADNPRLAWVGVTSTVNTCLALSELKRR